MRSVGFDLFTEDRRPLWPDSLKPGTDLFDERLALVTYEEVVNDPTLDINRPCEVSYGLGCHRWGNSRRKGPRCLVPYPLLNRQPRDWYVQ